MTSIGAEVGQKMRSAIKAKLLELNCYVDDELPDYVMVMVANKRSKSQMKEDLQLFLSTKTAPFVDWLHIVLKKLKEVTVTNPEVYKKAVKRSAESSDANVKKEKPDKKIKSEKKDGKSLTDDLPIDANKLSQQRKIVILNEQRIVNNRVVVNSQPQDNFDIPSLSEVNMSAEEELEDIGKKIQSVKSRLGIQIESEEEEEEDPVKIKEEILRNRDAARAKTVEQAKEKAKTPPPKRLKITFEDSSNQKSSIRERLGKRSWREASSRTREDVKRRRSDERRRKSSPDRRKSEWSDSRGNEGILSRLGVKSKISLPEKRRSSPEPAIREREVPSVVKIKPRTIPEDVKKMANKNLLLKAVADAQKSIAQTPPVGAAKPDALFTKTYKEKQMEKVEKKRVNVEKLRELVEISRQQQSNEASTTDDDEAEPEQLYVASPVKRIVVEQPEVSMSEDERSEPKFVVKLRGCESSAAKKSIKDRLDKRKSPSPIIFDKHGDQGSIQKTPVTIPDKLPPVHHPPPVKNKERCKFWPGCTKGDRCEFLHPSSQQCEKFPKCKFGENCLFLHPTCKFGSSCTRKDCMYSHKTAYNACKFYPNCNNPACTFFHPNNYPATVNRSSLIWKAK